MCDFSPLTQLDGSGASLPSSQPQTPQQQNQPPRQDVTPTPLNAPGAAPPGGPGVPQNPQTPQQQQQQPSTQPESQQSQQQGLSMSANVPTPPPPWQQPQDGIGVTTASSIATLARGKRPGIQCNICVYYNNYVNRCVHCKQFSTITVCTLDCT